MTADVLALSPELRFAAFAALSTGAGLLAARLAASRGATLRHGLCLAGLVSALAVPVCWAALPSVPWIVGELEAVHEVGGSVARATGRPWLALWGLVTAVLLLRTAFRLASVDRLFRTATPLDSAALTRVALRVAEQVGLARRPRIVCHTEVSDPATWGLTRSVVFLPPEARSWSEPRLRAVLLHEFTHVARRDALTQLVAEVCCAVFWFVPFAWMAARRMRLEREIACDATVVRAGARASGYARFLVRSTCGLHAVPRAAAALGEHGALERRVRALVDPTCAERRTNPAELATVIVAACTLVLAAATLTPVRRLVLPTPDVATLAPVGPAIVSPEVDVDVKAELPSPAPRSASSEAELEAPLSTPPEPPSFAEIVADTRRTSGVHLTGAEAAAVLVDDEGRLLGGALRPDPEHGLVLDEAVLRRFLGLPESAGVSSVVVPSVVRIRR